jgi:hypothetical protein
MPTPRSRDTVQDINDTDKNDRWKCLDVFAVGQYIQRKSIVCDHSLEFLTFFCTLDLTLGFGNRKRCIVFPRRNITPESNYGIPSHPVNMWKYVSGIS